MANIRNSINLTDRMTPVLRAVIKSMDSALRAMRALDQQANKSLQSKAIQRAEQDMKRANNEIIRMRNLTDLARGSADQQATAWGRVSNSISNATNSTHSMITSLASGIYVAKNLADQISEVMKAADSTRSYVARIGLFNTSDMTNEEVYGKVFQAALATRTELGETSNLVYKLLMSGAFGDTKQAPDQALAMASLINKALVAGGGTAEENSRALLQLNQALASGYLQGDELRSIREQAPYLARMLAEGLGRIDDKFIGTTIGDLKALGSQGELTTDRIIRALASMSDEIDTAFEAMPRTFGQAMTQMGSMWTMFLHQLSLGDGPLARINDRLWQMADALAIPNTTATINTDIITDVATNSLEVYNSLLDDVDGKSITTAVATDTESAIRALEDYSVVLEDALPSEFKTTTSVLVDNSTWDNIYDITSVLNDLPVNPFVTNILVNPLNSFKVIDNFNRAVEAMPGDTRVTEARVYSDQALTALSQLRTALNEVPTDDIGVGVTIDVENTLEALDSITRLLEGAPTDPMDLSANFEATQALRTLEALRVAIQGTPADPISVEVSADTDAAVAALNRFTLEASRVPTANWDLIASFNGDGAIDSLNQYATAVNAVSTEPIYTDIVVNATQAMSTLSQFTTMMSGVPTDDIDVPVNVYADQALDALDALHTYLHTPSEEGVEALVSVNTQQALNTLDEFFTELANAPDGYVDMTANVHADEALKAIEHLNRSIGGLPHGDIDVDISTHANDALRTITEYEGVVDALEGVSIDTDVNAATKRAQKDMDKYVEAVDSADRDIVTTIALDAEDAMATIDAMNQKLSEFDKLAMLINFFVSVILEAFDLLTAAWHVLTDNALVFQTILITAFIAIAAYATYAAVRMIISWIAAAWPIILIISLVGILIYYLLSLGFTASEIIGAIAGGVSFLAVVIYDVILGILALVSWLLGVIAAGVIALVSGIILIIQGIGQVVMWIVNAIWTAILALFNGLKTVGLTIWAGFQTVAGGIVDLIYNAASTIVSILSNVAQVIDAIFGSSFSASVSSFSAKLDTTYSTIKGYLDAGATFDSIGDMWDQFAEDTAFRWTDPASDWNIYGQISDVWNGAGDLIGDAYGLGTDISNGFIDGIVNPMEGWNAGYEWGAGVGQGLDTLDLSGLMDNLGGSVGLDDMLDALNAGVPVNGGDVDSVGKVKSDVDISDEDLRLLRDMAARDFLIQVNTVTPQAYITFGDVRETADVNRIMDVIEDMVEEQFATALVE